MIINFILYLHLNVYNLQNTRSESITEMDRRHEEDLVVHCCRRYCLMNRRVQTEIMTSYEITRHARAFWTALIGFQGIDPLLNAIIKDRCDTLIEREAIII